MLALMKGHTWPRHGLGQVWPGERVLLLGPNLKTQPPDRIYFLYKDRVKKTQQPEKPNSLSQRRILTFNSPDIFSFIKRLINMARH